MSVIVQMPQNSENPKWEKLSWLFTIIGTIISIIGLFVTLYFAVKTYYNSEQINRLDTLLANQQKEISQMADVANKLRTEINVSDSQLLILGKQLKISNQLLGEANTNAEFVKNGNLNKLYATIFTINSIAPPDKDNIDSANMVSYMQRVKDLLQSEFSNPILLQNDTVSHYWFYAYKTVLFFNYDSKHTVFVNDQGIQSLDAKGINKLFADDFYNCIQIISQAVLITNRYLRRFNPDLTFSIMKVPPSIYKPK